MTETKYVRTSRGRVVHLADCPKLRTRIYPWEWAENKTDKELVDSMRSTGIKPCRTCEPIGELWTAVEFELTKAAKAS